MTPEQVKIFLELMKELIQKLDNIDTRIDRISNTIEER